MPQILTGKLKDVIHNTYANKFADGETYDILITGERDIMDPSKTRYLKKLSDVLHGFTFENIDNVKLKLNKNVVDDTVEMRKNLLTYDFGINLMPSQTLYNEIIKACAKTFTKSGYEVGKFQVAIPHIIDVDGIEYMYKELLSKTPDHGCAREVEFDVPKILSRLDTTDRYFQAIRTDNEDESQNGIAKKLIEATQELGMRGRCGDNEYLISPWDNICYFPEDKLVSILGAGPIQARQSIKTGIFDRPVSEIQKGTLEISPENVKGAYEIKIPGKRIGNFWGCIGELPIIDGNEEVKYFNKGLRDHAAGVARALHILPRQAVA